MLKKTSFKIFVKKLLYLNIFFTFLKGQLAEFKKVLWKISKGLEVKSVVDRKPPPVAPDRG